MVVLSQASISYLFFCHLAQIAGHCTEYCVCIWGGVYLLGNFFREISHLAHNRAKKACSLYKVRNVLTRDLWVCKTKFSFPISIFSHCHSSSLVILGMLYHLRVESFEQCWVKSIQIRTILCDGIIEISLNLCWGHICSSLEHYLVLEYGTLLSSEVFRLCGLKLFQQN